MTNGGRGLYYEEFRVGSEFTTGSHVVTDQEIVAFAELTLDDNPLHTDPQLAKRAGFPNVIAHGMFVQSLAIGLIAETGMMRGTAVALLATSAEFMKPAVAGDELRVRVEVTRKRPTRSPARGIVWRRASVLKDDGTVVARLKLTALVRRSPVHSERQEPSL